MKSLKLLTALVLLVLLGYIGPIDNPKEIQIAGSRVPLKDTNVEKSTMSDIDCRRWDYDIEWQ